MSPMNAADSLAGPWLFTSYEGQPYKEPKIIMTITRLSELFTVTLNKDGKITFEMAGLARQNETILGKGINQVDGKAWEVTIRQTGADRAEAVFDEISPRESLAGTWGAEKIGG